MKTEIEFFRAAGGAGGGDLVESGEGTDVDGPEAADFWDNPDQLAPLVPYCSERSMELEARLEQAASEGGGNS
jgi:hypothetical protein